MSSSTFPCPSIRLLQSPTDFLAHLFCIIFHHLKDVSHAGSVPFKGDSILGLYEAIQTEEVVFPDDVFISDSLKHLILR